MKLFSGVVSEIGSSIWWHLANMRANIKDQCQAVIEIITGDCVWYERGKDGKIVVYKLCRREPDSVQHFYILVPCSKIM